MASRYEYHGASNPPATTASPYGSGDPYYNQSSGYVASGPPKKGMSNWVKFGIPVAILVIVGAVVGGVVGSRASKNNSSSAISSPAAASSAVSVKQNIGRFPTSTNTEYFMPVYPSTTNTAAFVVPTFISTTNNNLSWPTDSFQPANPSPTNVRTDRPRLIAPAYKWNALPSLMANDPYLSGWHTYILNNATAYYNLPPVVYHMDGSSGILDNAREIKMRIKAFAYAYRMTNDTKWVTRTWSEIQNAAGNGTASFGTAPDRWNSVHFLDTAEFTAAFAIAYDWLYDAWTPSQRSAIMFTMIEYGLSYGYTAYTNDPTGAISWWQKNTTGNWNCVCNNGLTMGSLAILGDDTSGVAANLLGLTIPNALANCALAVTSDGSWTETENYWYFGTTGHAEMASSLLTATGDHYGLMNVNQQFKETGYFHMYGHGPTSLFDFGDHGPNKFSSTANPMLFYGDFYKMPEYALYQRDMFDAAEPWSMFWYNPSIAGAFWDGLPLDRFFDNSLDQWGSMRSSWTDNNALFVAMKAGQLQNHQTHNDLDCGDFVLDAMGTRWAGELGSGDYLSTGYFSNDTQQSDRWLYYRKRTEGQNAIVVNGQNQLVTANPVISHDTSNTTQSGGSTVFQDPSGSTAYFTADLASAYSGVTSYMRGIRLINQRTQVLLQDDIQASQPIQWRMHTNATVTTNGATATLVLDGKQMTVSILNAPSGAAFARIDAIRLSTDPPLPPGQVDQPNPGVSVLTIDLPAGTYSLQVLFNPQWSGMSQSSFVTPPSVSLSSWTLTSHN